MSDEKPLSAAEEREQRANLAGDTVVERMLATLDAVRAECDAWKSRAISAEDNLQSTLNQLATAQRERQAWADMAGSIEDILDAKDGETAEGAARRVARERDEANRIRELNWRELATARDDLYLSAERNRHLASQAEELRRGLEKAQRRAESAMALVQSPEVALQMLREPDGVSLAVRALNAEYQLAAEQGRMRELESVLRRVGSYGPDGVGKIRCGCCHNALGECDAYPDMCYGQKVRAALAGAAPVVRATCTECVELREALRSAHAELSLAWRDWDADRDAKVGKRIGNAAEIISAALAGAASEEEGKKQLQITPKEARFAAELLEAARLDGDLSWEECQGVAVVEHELKVWAAARVESPK